MIHVLVVVTVFSTTSGISTYTAFQEFTNSAACEQARAGIVDGIDRMKGTIGRHVFADCYPKG